MCRNTTAGWVAVFAGIALSCATPAHAQNNEPAEDPQKQTPPPVERPRLGGLMDRPVAWLNDLRERGVRPLFGGLGSGSGFALGTEIRSESFFAPNFGASLSGTVSVRGYQAYDARIGRVTAWANRTELKPADADPLSGIDVDGDPAVGLSAYIHTRQRILRRLDYFGMNGGARLENRADFALTGFSTDAVIQWQISSRTGLSARGGWMRLDLGPGSNTDVPNLEDQFTLASLPGLSQPASYLTLGAGFVHDRRDRDGLPTSGFVLAATAWRFVPTNRGEAFGRVTFDARGYQSLGSDRHVLAARLLLSETSSRVDDVPFFMQGTLGGSRTLRGVRNFRFRGPALAHVSLEYRWHPFSRIEFVPFVDAGAAAASFASMDDDGVVVTPGISLRYRTRSSVLGRLDFAWGPDGRRIFLAVGAPF